MQISADIWRCKLLVSVATSARGNVSPCLLPTLSRPYQQEWLWNSIPQQNNHSKTRSVVYDGEREDRISEENELSKEKLEVITVSLWSLYHHQEELALSAMQHQSSQLLT